MSKMGNLYLELSERAQDFIADYADKKYFTLISFLLMNNSKFFCFFVSIEQTSYIYVL